MVAVVFPGRTGVAEQGRASGPAQGWRAAARRGRRVDGGDGIQSRETEGSRGEGGVLQNCDKESKW